MLGTSNHLHFFGCRLTIVSKATGLDLCSVLLSASCKMRLIECWVIPGGGERLRVEGSVGGAEDLGGALLGLGDEVRGGGGAVHGRGAEGAAAGGLVRR